LEELLNKIGLPQTIIFVNTTKFTETIFKILKSKGISVHIMFGKMMREERDLVMKKFRAGEIKVLLTTNLMSRGIDVPEVALVINFDVPTETLDYQARTKKPDFETYLHRIGRASRFGIPGLALTLCDRDEDEKHLHGIVAHYKMEDK
jgi:ATP-dependent RNA helicase DDX19/DBP5